MKKQKEKQIKVNKLNKNARYFLWTIFGILMLGGFVFATTNFITDQGITTPNGIFNNVTTSNLTVSGNLYSDSIYEISRGALVLSYNFNSINLNNNNSYDASGWNNHGAIFGTTQNPTGGFNSGGSLGFDGVDDYVTAGSPVLDYTLPFTMSFWIKGANGNSSYVTQRAFLGARGDDGSFTMRGGFFQGISGKVDFLVGTATTTTGNSVQSKADVFNNNWHHIVGVYNGTNILMYEDGTFIASTTLAFTPTTPNKNFAIGRDSRSSAYYFNGSFDDVRVYNRSLSSQEIKAMYLQRSELSDAYVPAKVITLMASGQIQSLNTSQLYFGNGTNGFGNYSDTRPLVTTSAVSVTVCDSGCTYTTVNEATKGIPFFLFHKYTITIKAPYSAYENIYLPPSLVASDMAVADIGAAGVTLNGNCSNVNQINVQSIHVLSNIGALHPYIQCMRVTGEDPNANEHVAISVVGSTDVQLQLMNLSGGTATNGILAYSGGISVAQIDMGSTYSTAFMTKHEGTFHFEPCVSCFGASNFTGNYNVIGSASTVYSNTGGIPFGFVINGMNGTSKIADAGRAPIFDATNKIAYGINTTNDNWRVIGNLSVDENTYQNTNKKHCLDGATCSHYMMYNGTDTIIT